MAAIAALALGVLQRLERVLHRFATTSLGIFLATISRSMPQFAALAALAAIGGVLLTWSLARFRRMLAEIGWNPATLPVVPRS